MTGNESQSAAPMGTNVASQELVEHVEALEAEAAKAASEREGAGESRDESTEPSPDGTEQASTDEAGSDSPESSTDAGDVTDPFGLGRFAEDKDLHFTLEQVAERFGEGSEGAMKVLTNRVTSNKILGKKLREVSAQAKDNEALIGDGQEYRKLFTDAGDRQAFLDWKAGKAPSTAPKESVADDVDPLDLDGPGLTAYVAKVAREAVAAERARVQEQTTAQQTQVAEAVTTVQTNLDTIRSEFFEGVNDDSWNAALRSARADLVRLHGDDDARLAAALRDPADVYDLMDVHVERTRRDSELEALRAEVAKNGRRVSRKVQASSTPGRRVAETEPDLSTPEGRLAAVERDAPGAWTTRPGT